MWNKDRAAAAEGHEAPLLSYSGHFRNAFNQKSRRMLGLQMVKDFTKPAAYTGEFIRAVYLYQQTGCMLEDVSMDPDAPDEAVAIAAMDEGIEEDLDNLITAIFLDVPSAGTAALSGNAADAPRSEPSGPAAPAHHAPPKVPGSQTPPQTLRRRSRILTASPGGGQESPGAFSQQGRQTRRALAMPARSVANLATLSLFLTTFQTPLTACSTPSRVKPL